MSFNRSLFFILICLLSIYTVKSKPDIDNRLVAAGSGVLAGAIAPLNTITEIAHYAVDAAHTMTEVLYHGVGTNIYSNLSENDKYIYMGGYCIPAVLSVLNAYLNRSQQRRRWILPIIFAYPFVKTAITRFDQSLRN